MIPVYYINMDARPERRRFMEQQLATLGLSAARIAATVPKDISASDMAAYCDPRRVRFLRPVELSCSLSHEAAWRQIISEGHAAGVVLEDDALLSKALPVFLAALGLPLPFDLIRFETRGQRSRLLPPVRTVGDISLRPYRSTGLGAAGYVISAAGAKTMIEARTARRVAVDHALFNPIFSPLRASQCVLTDPGLCIQAINATDGQSPVAESSIDTADAAEIMRAARQSSAWKVTDFFDRVRKTADHIRYLPRGVQRVVVAFRE